MKLRIWIPAAALAATLTACGTSTPGTGDSAHSDVGTVVGNFTRVGGPLGPGGAQPRPVPLTGTVFFAAGHRRKVTVQVGNTGRFSVRLPAGRYAVSGSSPSLGAAQASGADASRPCGPEVPLTVVAGRAVHVSVVCPVP